MTYNRMSPRSPWRLILQYVLVRGLCGPVQVQSGLKGRRPRLSFSGLPNASVMTLVYGHSALFQRTSGRCVALNRCTLRDVLGETIPLTGYNCFEGRGILKDMYEVLK